MLCSVCGVVVITTNVKCSVVFCSVCSVLFVTKNAEDLLGNVV